jgi:NADP-dependent 3-hydroxy acid dehydrogenase YdfG
VKVLLYAGCKVISGGRSIETATKSLQEVSIINSSNNNNNNNNNLNKNLIIYELDLESLSSIIKAFADKCLTDSCGRIDYLILNAGIMDIYLFLR